MYHTLGDSITLFSSARLEISTTVEEYNEVLNTFNLQQNYPNPFNPSTTIKFSIPTSPQSHPYQGGEANYDGLVNLKVYDIIGNEIASLVNEEKPAGEYEVIFDATGLSSGIYFYRLTAGKYTSAKKLILMK
ncbi:MAG: T9SS type A sorting domain-containing protein [Bacteroidetes bacterium]|nr:T9SS type A sorting domain-containing protein [Bacteroidota bacterium]